LRFGGKQELRMGPPVDHAALIRPFLSREARARFDEIDPGAPKRTRLLNRLCHDYESTLDWRTVQPIPAAEQTAELIAPFLRKLGAGRTCYVLCSSAEWDGLQVPLADALRELVGNGLPVLLICVPDSLAYFEPEYNGGAGRRFVLQR
jgi:hypothetical protein